jgi:hypothetical protein
VSWFQKFLGLGRKENTLLTLKLRLNRWRHFLRTEWACGRLLDDLAEKSRGEYIFDRQYVFSTVGRIFQQAYQAAYDGTLLDGKSDGELYAWLDGQKEKTFSYLSRFSRGDRSAAPAPQASPAGLGSGAGRTPEAEPDLDQEPEFRMLRGVIALLEGSEGLGNGAGTDQLENIKTLRAALRWTHEKVLGELISRETVRQWVEAGLAVPRGEKPSDPFYVIDLGGDRSSASLASREGFSLKETEKGLSPWPMIQEVLASFPAPPTGNGKTPGWSLCFIVNENALFLYGYNGEAVILLDMMLTNVRELNHFLLRWQTGSGGEIPGLKTLPSWAWTYCQEGKVYEFAACNKPPREIESYGEKVAKGWAWR